MSIPLIISIISTRRVLFELMRPRTMSAFKLNVEQLMGSAVDNSQDMSLTGKLHNV